MLLGVVLQQTNKEIRSHKVVQSVQIFIFISLACLYDDKHRVSE